MPQLGYLGVRELHALCMRLFVCGCHCIHFLPLASQYLMYCCPSQQDCYRMIDECELFQQEAHLAHDKEAQALHCTDVSDLHRIVASRADKVSAHILHFADEVANERGEIQTGLKQVGGRRYLATRQVVFTLRFRHC